MGPRLVSWVGKNEEQASAAMTASVIPIDSLPSPITPESSKGRLTGPASILASLLGMGLGGSETPDSHCGSFLQHGKYFFKDGNVTFLVDGFLFCVHRYFFCRDSAYFATRFARLRIPDHEVLSTIISLGDVKCDDFEIFLSVLYPEKFEEHDLSYDEWKSVLHLSTHWGFASLRELALMSMRPPSAYDQLLLARQYSVDAWIVSAITTLCQRETPLSLDEANIMSMEDVVLITTIREHIRSKDIQFGVGAADISRCVEAMKAGVPMPAVTPPDLTDGAPVECLAHVTNGMDGVPFGGVLGTPCQPSGWGAAASINGAVPGKRAMKR